MPRMPGGVGCWCGETKPTHLLATRLAGKPKAFLTPASCSRNRSRERRPSVPLGLAGSIGGVGTGGFRPRAFMIRVIVLLTQVLDAAHRPRGSQPAAAQGFVKVDASVRD